MLFSELTDEERAVLIARAPTRTLAPGETVFLMGSRGNNMMVVQSGSVRISISSPDGKELTLAIIQKDEIFGEMTMLDRKERTADATAMTACKLAILERREMLSFLQAHPAVLLRLVDMLCSRLRRTDQHFAELALLPVPARLAKALLRVAAATCSGAANGEATLPIQLSQRELGTMVGATRESINKYLRAWQSRGLVRMRKSLITIVDRKGLEELAEMGHASCSGPQQRRGFAVQGVLRPSRPINASWQQ
jgi:CRP/FNR family transcriptional regulator, cyclic AMP receptor protein